ncbi:GNAT family N-acetyltransferase [Phytomonospora sp. NPDC050363]|uniref:GNAT family N-acetyltransferase n=1 Tax=Phytomonospora sp. NPDC050363 TaxID=3155642 RepID=UPI0033E98541
MPLDIRALDTVSPADIADYHGLMGELYAVEFPDIDPPTVEAVETMLRPNPADVGTRVWLGREGGRLVGGARLDLLGQENVGLARIGVRVRPVDRRRGLGTALLQSAIPAIRDSGYDRLIGGAWGGGPGSRWAAAQGFRTTASFVMQRLEIAGGGWRALAGPMPDGFELRRWVGRVPDDMVESYVDGLIAFEDRPGDQASWRFPSRTVERLRDEEERLLGRGVEQRGLVAMESATGAVAGMTVVELTPDDQERAFQKVTAVLPRHRGLGLGVRMKTAMLAWIEDDRPGVRRIQTGTATANVHMIRINHALGFADAFVSLALEQSVAELLQRFPD